MISGVSGSGPAAPDCTDRACPLQGEGGARCWAEPDQHCHRPLDASSFGDLVQRFCDRCPVLEGVRARARGRRRADRLADEAIDRLGQEIDASARTLADAADRLRHTLDELSLIQEVSLALGAARDRAEIASLLLAGITAGEGYGLNRAFLFVCEAGELRGLDAVGPANAADAARVYADLAGHRLHLDDLVQSHEATRLGTSVRAVRIPCDDARHPLSRLLAERRPRILRRGGEADLDGIPDPAPVSLVVPLEGGDGALGLLVADNLYTGREPGPEDLSRVASLASQAAVAMERVDLQQRLGEKVLELRGACQVLGDAADQSQAADRLASLGEVVAQVLHGLKNSLVVIGGHARHLSRRKDRPERERRSLGSILAEVVHLEEIVATLLETGRPFDPGRLQPGDLAARAATLEQAACERGDVELVVEAPSGGAMVRGDADQLLLVLRNILQNARDASPPGGEVRLRTRVESGRVVFEVEDSGPGLSDESKSRAGEAFYTTKRSGTGLGLWLARRVLRRHGGQVVLADTPGGGLTVRLELPEAADASVPAG